MKRNEIIETRDTIIAEDGPWTAHWFELAPGVWTLPKQDNFSLDRARLALNTAILLLGKPAADIRVLDIGCLEGGIAIELARLGCDAIGLEIRAPSLRKARFVAEALGLSNVSFVQGDMLAMSEMGLGAFDLVICAGTLYHVNAPDLVPFLSSINSLCRGIAVVDTHVSVNPSESFLVGKIPIFGESIVEHLPSEQGIKAEKLWAAAENSHAFWPTERSLIKLLLLSGFQQVIKPVAPIPEWGWKDRDYWVACSEFHAKRLGLNLLESVPPLPEPDLRPAQCPTIQEADHKLYPNPETTVLSDELYPNPATTVLSDERWGLLLASRHYYSGVSGMLRRLLPFPSEALLMERMQHTPLAPPPDFDDTAYLTRYPDIAKAVADGMFSSGFDHYFKHGRKEDRFRPTFKK